MSADTRFAWLTSLALFPVCLVVLSERLRAAKTATFPGHADAAFYYSLAKNIASGRGMVIDYVWHFQSPPRDLTHFAPDYWMPAPALVMAGAERIFGLSPATAVATNVWLSVAVAAATWLLARRIGARLWVAPASAALVFLSGPVAHFSVTTESSMCFALFVAVSASLLVGPRSPRWRLLAAGVAVGLAHLSRNDGLMLLPIAVVWVCFSVAAGSRLSAAAQVLGGYLCVALPFSLVMYLHTGRAFPSYGRLPFLLAYEDLFASPATVQFDAFFELGAKKLIGGRYDAIGERIATGLKEVGGITSIAAVAFAGMAVAKRRARSVSRCIGENGVFFGALLTLALVFTHAVVTPVVSTGAFTRSLPALMPFAMVTAVYGLDRLRLWNLSKLLLFAALLVAPSYFDTRGVPERIVATENKVGEGLAGLHAALSQEAKCIDGEVVVMTRDPWEVTELTGFRSVQIPSGDAVAIAAQVDRWKVTHIVVSSRRPAVAKLRAPAGPFVQVPANGTVLLRSRDVPLKAGCR